MHGPQRKRSVEILRSLTAVPDRCVMSDELVDKSLTSLADMPLAKPASAIPIKQVPLAQNLDIPGNGESRDWARSRRLESIVTPANAVCVSHD
jgi:hypothetical protein